MDLNIHNKCRICLASDTDANFIHLEGSKAEMFTEVIGVELTIDGVKTESVICQNCFSVLENFNDFKAKGVRAHRENFEIQQSLEITLQETNEQEQATDEVEASEAATAANEPNSPSRVKHEPPVEFVLILPRATIDRSAEEYVDINNDSNRKWVESVALTRFDAKWSSDSTLFQTFLTCQHCRLVVNHQGRLTQHLKTCSEISPARFECDICGERVQNKSRMSQHVLKHSTGRNFRGTECGNGFKSKRKLTAHKRTHNKPYACTTCQKKFAKNQLLKLHQMQHRHGIYATAPEVTFDCSTCDKTFSTPQYLKKHHRQAHDEKAAKCGVCYKIFKNRASLLNHSGGHTKVECPICHKLVSKNKLNFHVRSHSNRFDCDLCALSFNAKCNLKSHIERKHLLKKLVKNSKHQKNFSDVELLEELQLKYGSSASSAEKKFKCDKCKTSFATTSSLNHHKRQVHHQKLFDCLLCTKAYKTKGNLKQHEARVHTKMSIK